MKKYFSVLYWHNKEFICHVMSKDRVFKNFSAHISDEELSDLNIGQSIQIKDKHFFITRITDDE